MEVTTTSPSAPGGIASAAGTSLAAKSSAAQSFNQAMTSALQTGVSGGASADSQAAPAAGGAQNAAVVLAAILQGAGLMPNELVSPELLSEADPPILSEVEGQLPLAGVSPDFTTPLELPAEGALAAQIDNLLDQLFDGDEEEDEPQISVDEWQQAASELAAMLSLLGIKPPPALQVSEGENPQLNSTGTAAVSAAKLEVQEMLLLVQQHSVSDGQSVALDAKALTQTQLDKLQNLLNEQNRSQTLVTSNALIAADDEQAVSMLIQHSVNEGQPITLDAEALTQIQLDKRQALLNEQKRPQTQVASKSVNGSEALIAPRVESFGISLLARLDAATAHLRAEVTAVEDSSNLPGSENQPVQESSAESIPPAGSAVFAAGSAGSSSTENAADAEGEVKIAVHRFAQEMTGVVLRKLDINSGSGLIEARLRLTPEHLGQVDVRLQLHNGQLTAMFTADSPAAREALENQMSQLRLSLQNQGLQVDRLDVTQSSVQTSLSFGGHNQGRGGQPGSQQFQQSAGSVEDHSTSEAGTTQTVIRELGFGRAVNETA